MRGIFVMLCGVSLTKCACEFDQPSTPPVPAIYVAQKYHGTVVHVIDKYVALCVNLEHAVGAVEFFAVRRLVFTHPCIIRCYNDMLLKKSVQPLVYLWQAYKQDAVVVDKQKFIYELCHLIAVVFEQFLVKLTADFTGQSVESLTQLLDKLQIDLPLDDLIDILEQCYQHLSTVTDHLIASSQQKPLISKKILVVLIGVAALVIHQLHHYFGETTIKPVPVQ